MSECRNGRAPPPSRPLRTVLIRASAGILSRIAKLVAGLPCSGARARDWSWPQAQTIYGKRAISTARTRKTAGCVLELFSAPSRGTSSRGDSERNRHAPCCGARQLAIAASRPFRQMGPPLRSYSTAPQTSRGAPNLCHYRAAADHIAVREPPTYDDLKNVNKRGGKRREAERLLALGERTTRRPQPSASRCAARASDKLGEPNPLLATRFSIGKPLGSETSRPCILIAAKRNPGGRTP